MSGPAEYCRKRLSKRLIGTNCPDCGIRHFPGRVICPDCGSGGTTFDPEKAMELRKKVLAARVELGK